jgi:hypothetical protein
MQEAPMGYLDIARHDAIRYGATSAEVDEAWAIMPPGVYSLYRQGGATHTEALALRDAKVSCNHVYTAHLCDTTPVELIEATGWGDDLTHYVAARRDGIGHDELRDAVTVGSPIWRYKLARCAGLTHHDAIAAVATAIAA